MSNDLDNRPRTGQAELLASLQARLAELDRFWEKEQTKADMRVFIMDEVFMKLPTRRSPRRRPFTQEKKELIAGNVYAHVWQRAMSGGLGRPV